MKSGEGRVSRFGTRVWDAKSVAPRSTQRSQVEDERRESNEVEASDREEWYWKGRMEEQDITERAKKRTAMERVKSLERKVSSNQRHPGLAGC